MGGARVLAVILDLDGTLLDTERATKDILKEFLAKYGKVLDPEKEDKRLGMMHKESAASIVVDYELPLTADEFSVEIMPLYRQRWPQAKALPGADRLIKHLSEHGVPLALASNSIRKHIETKISHHQGWKESFSVIVGGDEVNHGKPSPDIFLEAAKKLGVDISTCLVIEDSLVGVRAAKAAGAKVVAVPSFQSQADCFSIATCVLHSLLEFQPELWGLPTFDDWVQNALPIEPLYIRGPVVEGVPHGGCRILNLTDDHSSFGSVPDQLSGVLFGWAKLDMYGIFKAAVTIGWDHHSNIDKRVIKTCLISGINDSNFMEQLQLLVVGYIRKLNNEENISKALEISEEDKSIASSVLDLPMFAHHMSSPLLAEAACGEERCLLD